MSIREHSRIVLDIVVCQFALQRVYYEPEQYVLISRRGGVKAATNGYTYATCSKNAPPACPYPSRKQMKVERRDGETVEQLLRRFNKGVVAERITKTYREKMHFVSKSEQRKEKRRRAERNRLKKARQTQ